MKTTKIGSMGWLVAAVMSVMCLPLLGGCQGTGALIPPKDPDLKKTAAQFAADAAKRTYPAEAPRGGDAQAQASVDHGVFNRIEMLNLSDDNWTDLEVWVNGTWVFHVSNWPAHSLKKVNFATLFDRDGKPFPMDNKSVRVNKIEILREGKVYDVPMKLAD
jgi:hypothetical protein